MSAFLTDILFSPVSQCLEHTMTLINNYWISEWPIVHCNYCTCAWTHDTFWRCKKYVTTAHGSTFQWESKMRKVNEQSNLWHNSFRLGAVRAQWKASAQRWQGRSGNDSKKRLWFERCVKFYQGAGAYGMFWWKII